MASAQVPPYSFDVADLQTQTVKQLKGKLKALSLTTQGNKSELIKRLIAYGTGEELKTPAGLKSKQDELEELKLELELLKTRQQIDSVKLQQKTDQQSLDLVSLINNVTINSLPRPEPPVFSGDVLQYPDWNSAFTTLIDKCPIPENEKIFYLRKYITGKAKEAVEGYLLLNTSAAYRKARDVLEN